MNSPIFKTVAPFLTSLMLLFSLFVLLRGHNAPGGGFIGGLVAVAALAIYGAASGVETVRRAIVFHPVSVAAFGLFLSCIAGFVSAAAGVPFMTGLWATVHVLGSEVALSTVMLFDLGVYLVVVGALLAIVLALEEEEGV
ncbi:Na(+)/H(+) antiporter subunit B [Rhizobium sp. LjRoot30]|uniref:Na(+)/H(+) antiporter subunit B n=1 Tax=Rhizobium sp. LjRoot30 TaxID=3342320 RepID=UPI003ECEF383